MGPKPTISRWSICSLMLLLTCGSVVTARADMAQTQLEIAHLMDHIAGSDCRFIRNGKAYDAEAARDHIQKKYDYMRSRIQTAEDFIHHAAAKSSMSGEPYRIVCGGETLLCADWLHAELRRYRAAE